MDQFSTKSEKVAFFLSMFVGRKNVFARGLRVRKQERKVIRRIARTSGCEEFAVY